MLPLPNVQGTSLAPLRDYQKAQEERNQIISRLLSLATHGSARTAREGRSQVDQSMLTSAC